jgi:hypothetical protein
LLTECQTCPDGLGRPSYGAIPSRALPIAGGCLTKASAASSGNMPIVESTWLCEGVSASPIALARMAQMPQEINVAMVQNSDFAVIGSRFPR